MARVKATTTDIYARLARGECANFRSSGCQGRTPCTVIVGEPCSYFSTYVQPLLDYPEFANKYGREAKITVALNPQAKVVRKRRQAGEPALALDEQKSVPIKTPPARTTKAPKSPPVVEKKTVPPIVETIPIPVVPASTPLPAVTLPHTRPALASAAKRTVAPIRPAAMEQPELFLELTPVEPVKRRR